MSNETWQKTTINWLVFAASVIYSVWVLIKLLSVFFILGDNDTLLAVLSAFVFGLVPLPTSLLAPLLRKIGAGVFAAIALLFAAGLIDDDCYIAARNGTSVSLGHEIAMFLAPVLPLVLFALFYLITDLLRWPKLRKTYPPPSSSLQTGPNTSS